MARTNGRVFLALLLAVTLVLSLGLAGCNGGGTAEGEGGGATETLKVGVHTSLTGGLADYGFAAENGLRLAAEEFSEVTVGDKTYKIELVVLDDKGEPAEASVVAQSLVDQGVVGVIGALTSGGTNAALPIYQSAGIPVISGSATNPDLTEGDFDNFFRTCLRDDLQGKAIGQWAVAEGYDTKAVVFDDKGDYAVGLGNYVEEELKAQGVEVQREHCQEGDTDFSAQVANIKAFDPQVVIFTGYHREAGLLRKQMVEAGLEDVQLMGGDGIKSDEIAQEAGGAENVEGALCTFGSLSPEQMPGFEQFKADYKEATGKDAGPYAENNYDALGALVMAMETAGSTEGADIIAALHEITYEGIMGSFGFDEKGDIAIAGAQGIEAIPHFKMTGGTWTYIQE